MPSGGAQKPTLRTIAELSGLAVPTVSRALNDAPDIGDKTKARIRKIADEIGYVPNRAGVRLRTGKTNVISLVLGSDNESTNHSGQLIASIAQELRNTAYHLIVTPYFQDEDPMRPIRYLVETGSADAIILNRIEAEDARIAYLMERKHPFVAYGRTIWRNKHAYFDFDNESFGRIAAQTMIGNGCREVAILAPPLGQNYAQDMIRGATHVLGQKEIPFSVVPGISIDDPAEFQRTHMGEFFQENPKCDGIICPSTTSAMSVVIAAERLGRVIGKDLYIFGKEAVPFLSHFRPAIQTVREDVMHAGSFLSRAAIDAIEHPENPPRQMLVSARRAEELVSS